MNLLCRFFGHDEQPWFKTLFGAASQIPFENGICCDRCGELLYLYDDNDNLIRQPSGTKAPPIIDSLNDDVRQPNDHPNIEDEELRLLEQRINSGYHPKAEMCQSCQAWSKDCSGMDFKSMPIINETGMGKTVECQNWQQIEG